jgi:hypothetical protein
LVGAAVDTTAFLLVAFGTMDTWGAQWVGKVGTILLVAAVLQVWGSRRVVTVA